MSIPPQFDNEFLEWFRARTELAWAGYEPRDFMREEVGGFDWQPGTRWRGGLPEAMIAAVEERWQVEFPPDYRLILERLHTVDPPMIGARYVDSGAKIRGEHRAFPDWSAVTPGLEAALVLPFDGLLFDVEQNGLWLSSWGPRPADPTQCREELRRRVAAAPRLIPVYQHRYLLADPCIAGNPVLSVHQSDIIVYGVDLRTYLLVEFARLLGLDADREFERGWQAHPRRIEEVPFWGEVATWRGGLA